MAKRSNTQTAAGVPPAAVVVPPAETGTEEELTASSVTQATGTDAPFSLTYISELESEVESLKEQLDAAKADLDEAMNIIQQQHTKLGELDAEKDAVSSSLYVVVDDRKYEVISATHDHSAQDIANDPDIAAEILAIEGQNILRLKS
ncbi:MAG: hypothetical protein INR69_15075 [Mucilaginibacter polytrichastri]|nr:hypothetical protein [Mucilaginibacter polytrichastri]